MTYKAIIQLTSGDADVIKSAASQIKNLLKALNNDVQVEVVCHGKSLAFVLNEDNKWGVVIKDLLSHRVRIVACMNMLSANGKQAADLFPGIDTVPAAIAELVIKQQEGWSYIKTGF